MAILALIFLLIALVLFVLGAFGGSGPAHLDVGPGNGFDTSTTAVFVMGMVSMAALAVSLGCFRLAARGAAKRRAERKQLKKLNKKVEHYESDRHDRGGDEGAVAHGHDGSTDRLES